LTFALIFEQTVVSRNAGGRIEVDATLVVATLLFLALFLFGFIFFFPVPYGYPGPVSEMKRMRWLQSWNIA